MSDLTYTAHRFFNHQHYDVVLHGSWFSLTVTADDVIAENWARAAFTRYGQYLSSGTAVIGLAIQWNHYISNRENGPPNTMQLCVGELCLVFQLTRAQHVPQLLRDLLLQPHVTYVGIKNNFDRMLLLHSRHAVEVSLNLYDVRSFLVPTIASKSLYAIINACLGHIAVTWRPQIRFSDWCARTLSDHQALAAAHRSRCAFLIYRNYQVWRQQFPSNQEQESLFFPFRVSVSEFQSLC